MQPSKLDIGMTSNTVYFQVCNMEKIMGRKGVQVALFSDPKGASDPTEPRLPSWLDT